MREAIMTILDRLDERKLPLVLAFMRGLLK